MKAPRNLVVNILACSGLRRGETLRPSGPRRSGKAAIRSARRRTIGTQRNMREARHRLGLAVFQGRRGGLCQRYFDGTEDQLGALGLVINAIIF